ncbi:hypothetical protein LguiB_009156 [Lonicera macranthoides]
MNRRREHLSICSLIDDSIRPYTEQVLFPLTKEKEKQLLIALSQVLRQIKLWTNALDDDSDNEAVAKPNGSRECSVVLMSHSEHCCLTKIIGDLIFLLAIESGFVQHLAGNILGAISEFVAASGSNWDKFMRSLCLCLELAIYNSLSSSWDPPTGAKGLDYDSLRDSIALKAKLKDANWFSVAAIVRVLRNLLKYLKQEYDDQLFEIYLDSINACLLNVPWDRLNGIHVDQSFESLRSSTGESSLYFSVGQSKSIFMFWGNLVQFFCSLVGHSGSAEAAAGCLDKYPVVCEISKIFPKLLDWCIADQRDFRNSCISNFFRHKVLMLMIRLSFQTHLDHSTLVSWLHLIHKYFEDLISEPITQLEPDQDDCLEGSPFLASLCDAQNKSMSSRHLQRLVIFLFLRCSSSLVNLRDNIEPCVCENLDSCLVFDQNTPRCCSRNEGLSELCQWLQRHLPVDIFVDHEMYSEKCTGFALSFLKLYMHEDDILFKVLLQLFCVPFCSDQQVCKGKRTSQAVKDDALSLLSNLFHPIRLFHLFLAELSYDHQVLLDYLISKDTGASSAEYLLKCLRAIGDSWDLFMDFSLGGNTSNQSSLKKRKFVVDGVNFQGNLLSTCENSDEIPLLLEKECKSEHIYRDKHHSTSKLPFNKAVDCLLSLKNSLDNLHQKNLFPYNPEALLRRCVSTYLNPYIYRNDSHILDLFRFQ